MEAKFKVGEKVIVTAAGFKIGIVKEVLPYETRSYTKDEGFPPHGDPQGEIVIRHSYRVFTNASLVPNHVNESDLEKIDNEEEFYIQRKAGL